MRFTSIVLNSDGSDDITFSLREIDRQNRYIVRSIVGIDADEIIPRFYSSGLETGTKFYEATMKPREIVMRVAINPLFHVNETVEDIRDKIYRIISANRSGNVGLTWFSGGSTFCYINGMITKMEVAHFAQIPELQITLLCGDPIFRSIFPIDWDIAELPSANPVQLPDNASTAPHGLSFKVKFTATTASFTVQDAASDPDWKFEVTPPGGFATNDELWFSSEFGAKELFWNKAAGTDVSLMDMVTAPSVWPQIFPGNNELYFIPIANIDWLEVRYYSAYWGL